MSWNTWYCSGCDRDFKVKRKKGKKKYDAPKKCPDCGNTNLLWIGFHMRLGFLKEKGAKKVA